MFFIRHIIETYKNQKPIYLGGSHDSDVITCVKVSEGRTKMIRLLKCAHEEADDRIMYHAISVENFQHVVVAFADRCIYIIVVPLRPLDCCGRTMGFTRTSCTTT